MHYIIRWISMEYTYTELFSDFQKALSLQVTDEY